MNDKERDCNQCGHPAVYRQPDGGLLCEACVHSDHGFEEGRQFMAAEHLMIAAEVARARGYTEADLHALITEAMKDDPGEAPHADVPRLSMPMILEVQSGAYAPSLCEPASSFEEKLALFPRGAIEV